MAGFGFIKPQATNVRAGDVPSFKDLSMQEKLMMLGATMRGDMQGAQQIPLMAAARARQAQQEGVQQEYDRFLSGEGVPTLTRRDRPAIAPEPEPQVDAAQGAATDVMSRLGGLDGVPMKRDRVNVDVPQFGVDPGERRAGPPTLRDAIPYLRKLQRAGIDIKPHIDMLDKAGPDLREVNGLILDMRDTKNEGRQLPKLGEGQKYLFDEFGRVEGVKNADGYVQSVADLERAKAEATEGVKAGYDVGVYEDADGVPRRMTRAQAAGALNGNVPMVGGRPAPQLPGAGSTPGGVPDISRGQTAADKALAEGRAANQVKAEGMEGEASTQAAIDLPRNRATAEQTLKVIQDLRKHPGRQFGTGMTGVIPAMPGTATKDFDVMLKQARGKVFLEAFASLKGGGAITEREGQAATEAIARLDRQQSEEGFLAALADLEGVVKGALARSSAKASRAPTASAGRITPEQARAELARRRAAQ